MVYEVFWVGEEANLPTFLNFGLLALASAFLFIVGITLFGQGDTWKWHWLAFASLILLFAFDEAAQVHEPVGFYLTRGIEGRGAFRWTWVIAGLSFVALLSLVSFRFLRALPTTTKRLVLLAFAVYFGGALGLEMVSAYLFDNDMEHGRIATLAEETFEMLGAALLGAAALHQLRSV